MLLDRTGAGGLSSSHGRAAPGRSDLPEEPQPEWYRYRIRIPQPSQRHHRDGAVLTDVHHVAHIPEARRILEDKRIRAGLVYDESRLKRSRTCVAWASANTWPTLGSIYGNVQFTFDWSDILRDRQIYWVEHMLGYRPSAYRLLLTDRDLAPGVSRNVIPYDPAVDKGPLRKRDGVWYWNGDYTSELMVEDDLPLRLCRSVSFIKHRRDICRLHGSSCADRTASAFETGGRFMAFLLGNGLHGLDRAFRRPASMRSRLPLVDSVGVGIEGIMDALRGGRDRFDGGIRRAASSRAVLRGALAHYGADQVDQARALVSQLASAEVFDRALERVVNDHFGIEDWTAT
jgi:hypothetical protein